MGNELKEEVIKVVEKNGSCRVSFDVTGRTMHKSLSEELERILPEYTYDIDYISYKCKVSK